jgi:transposase-like protein
MLSDREQRAIQMVEVSGLSYREAARELGIKLENLKMVIFRARRKIHRSMRRVFDGLSPDLRPARDPVRRQAAADGNALEEQDEQEDIEEDANVDGGMLDLREQVQ